MAQRPDARGVHHVDPTKQFELESPAQDEEETPARAYSPGLLWAGGAATAFVAGLVAVVGILTARGLLDIAVLAPQGHGAWGGADAVAYTLAAAGSAFAATGLLQLMLTTTPDAVHFFTWIILLLTAITAVLPLGLEADTGSRVATATLNTLIGIAIAVSLGDVARRSRR
ncbi:DUF6069 family protein [Actinosynnema sp. NPDC047251]|uniref:Uncharacterized protein n=1 Tax=Saccharothrix espanaensis (strain ATCC 51144 / DSM 44229 / JCM 9112 / NBRC 15066 / NRRL 15764) TaxID=1179773 RepID=K0K896_SACES|nr:DUF6069 family protein [Saccharothrix espanaensis]CCH32903.1 hypothetical protein BN6_56440 [Saccharothrix espanaensis DSM 44229]